MRASDAKKMAENTLLARLQPVMNLIVEAASKGKYEISVYNTYFEFTTDDTKYLSDLGYYLYRSDLGYMKIGWER